MKTLRLGRTNLIVPQLAFGALPIQRTPQPEAGRILRKAFDAGIRFFDTARAYSDSEQKLGEALSDVRSQIVIASKTVATTAQQVREHLAITLGNLRTDYVDILQLHNPETLPNPNDPDSSYAALVEAKRKGQIRFIGITNHRFTVAREAVLSGLYDTLQFPLSYISSEQDLALIDLCKQHDIGVIAMKALCGGLLTNIPAAFAFFRQYENVAPIWGIQREWELDEFLELEAHPPVLDEAMRRDMAADKSALSQSFCRGCGYCLPCPNEVPIPMAARMSFLLRRAPYQQFLTPQWREAMHRIEKCTNCGSCSSKCPYGLDTPDLLKKMLADYDEFAAGHA